MVTKNSILVKNLSPKLSPSDREDLMKNFGALNVAFTSRSDEMIAHFVNECEAKRAIKLLHQEKLLNECLYAEFHPNSSKQTDSSSEKLPINAPIGVNYAYPPATPLIADNISHCLLTHPSFYIQVLHLMNIFHLPAPFHQAHHHTLNSSYQKKCKETKDVLEKVEEVTSSESEIESSPDPAFTNIVIKEPKQIIFPKVRHRTLVYPSLPFLPSERIDVSQTFPDYFAPKTYKPNFRFNVPNTLSRDPPNFSVVAYDGGEVFVKHGDHSLDGFEVDGNQNRLVSRQEQMIEEYERGDPCNRLYLKNISYKHVSADQLLQIFQQFEHGVKLDYFVKGRMRGQAFLTYSSVQAATNALNQTHLTLLQGKPLFVSFSKKLHHSTFAVKNTSL